MTISKLMHSAVLVPCATCRLRFGSAQVKNYPPLQEFMMPRDAEIALAKNAAPKNISDRATIRVGVSERQFVKALQRCWNRLEIGSRTASPCAKPRGSSTSSSWSSIRITTHSNSSVFDQSQGTSTAHAAVKFRI